jgi:hypothetical protein
MTIANPIYDIVFKYLMEDLDIAKGLLSAILEVEILELAMQPQETISEMPQDLNKSIRVYRIDFAAVIKQSDGQTKKVLIELQKTKRNTNVTRFRRYLGENYQKEDVITENGKETKRPLEIITIYLLGFSLSKIPTAILHSKPSFRDVINNSNAEYAHLEEFIKLLTHESYFIQIPKLVEPTKTRIERILSIFNQTLKSSDEHSLNYEQSDNDPLLQKMINRLTRAIASEDMRRKMNVEDEIEREFADYQETIEQKDAEIRQTKQELQQKDQELEQTKRLVEELLQKLAQQNK